MIILFALFSCQSTKLLIDDSADDLSEDPVDWDPSVDALSHLTQLQLIADLNDGNRAVGTPGYAASVDYVTSRLTAAGYSVERQVFSIPFFSELSPPNLLLNGAAQSGESFVTMENSPAGDVSGLVQAVDLFLPPGSQPNSSSSGCEESDFIGFVPGNIALLQRGTCTFHQKAVNAQNAGAAGVLIFNEGQPGRQDAERFYLSDSGLNVPVLSLSFDLGQSIASAGAMTIQMIVDTNFLIVETENVLAERPVGSADRVVVVGAHLDSVFAGPGVNDNGSGVAALLTIAERWSQTNRVSQNRLRFAFWGAEEIGLLGSQYYVENLSDSDRAKVLMNLNFDMIASPNYVRFVYDGDGSDFGREGPQGSGDIEDVFTDYFDSLGLEHEPTAFDGRSDYGPFIAAGIPAGGVFSGAEGLKTIDQSLLYGGVAQEPFDLCYHESCDTELNVNSSGLSEMLGGVVYAVSWAENISGIGGRSSPLVDYKSRMNAFPMRGCKAQR